MRAKSILGFLAFALTISVFGNHTDAQLLRRIFQPRQTFSQDCPTGVCPTNDCPVIYPQISPGPVVVLDEPVMLQPAPQLDGKTELAMEDWGRTAARCVVGNSCGSASLCGFYNGGTLFLTNAHVAGTRPGTSCKIRMVIDGKTKEFTGRTIMAAYSDKTLTDWCVVLVEEKIDIEPRYLAKVKPSGSHTTVGSPRCVWPLVRQNLRTAEVSNNSALWRWTPNSIGGQSGSGVWSLDDGKQYGLLTWSWGGLGAGQQTSEIYRQAKERSVAGEPRPDGLFELNRPDGVICENGFFQEAGITDLPIWGEPETDPAPGPKPDPDCDCDDGTEEEKGLLKRLRDRAKERNIDIAKLIQLILMMLELFAK